MERRDDPKEGVRLDQAFLEVVQSLSGPLTLEIERAFASRRASLKAGTLKSLRRSLVGATLTRDFSARGEDVSTLIKGTRLRPRDLRRLTDYEVLALPVDGKWMEGQQAVRQDIALIDGLIHREAAHLAETAVRARTANSEALLQLLNEERVRAVLIEALFAGVAEEVTRLVSP